jgi:hypothetical protein
MKHLTWILGLVFVFIVAGCNFGKKAQEEAEKAAEEALKAAEEAAAEEAAAEEEEAEEESPEEEEAEEEGPEMAVAKEDIDKAVAIYEVMHNEDLTTEAKDKKFKEALEENEWDKESFQKLIYDITQDPASRTYYNEQVGVADEG